MDQQVFLRSRVVRRNKNERRIKRIYVNTGTSSYFMIAFWIKELLLSKNKAILFFLLNTKVFPCIVFKVPEFYRVLIFNFEFGYFDLRIVIFLCTQQNSYHVIPVFRVSFWVIRGVLAVVYLEKFASLNLIVRIEVSLIVRTKE